jgi:hypothetical protein
MPRVCDVMRVGENWGLVAISDRIAQQSQYSSKRMFLFYKEMQSTRPLGPMIASALYWRFRSKA